jgi:Domain of unknown function (DUF6471)
MTSVPTENIGITWTTLASRVMRGVLARKGLSYADAARALRDRGAHDTERSVEGKIQRGTFRTAFALQMLAAIDAEVPQQWKLPLDTANTWEQKASALIQTEMALHPGVNHIELRRRLATVGVELESHALVASISSGTFLFTLLLQTAAVLPMNGLERFVDAADLRAACTRGR